MHCLNLSSPKSLLLFLFNTTIFCFQCLVDGCGKLVTSKKRHLRVKHKLGDPLSCGQCDYTSFSDGNLRKHQRKHDKPTKMATCPICYNNEEENDIFDHMRKVHKVSQMKCEISVQIKLCGGCYIRSHNAK